MFIEILLFSIFHLEPLTFSLNCFLFLPVHGTLVFCPISEECHLWQKGMTIGYTVHRQSEVGWFAVLLCGESRELTIWHVGVCSWHRAESCHHPGGAGQHAIWKQTGTGKPRQESQHLLWTVRLSQAPDYIEKEL